ncbi:MAG: MFS transporter, partial [Myxococcales bacterium]|nr:MFS transporter [Myxococcales bacterium]
GILGESAVPTINGGNLTQEWVLNFNALLISFFAFAMGYVTGKVESLTAIMVGIAISAVGIFMLGTMNGWTILMAIGMFSIGEMSASPTKMRFLANLAPPGKSGQYMGYANFTVGIGWSIGSVVAGDLYEKGGDKLNLAAKYLQEKIGMSAEAVGAIKRADLQQAFMDKVGVDAWEMRQLLWDTYSPQSMWIVFMIIGLAAGGAIFLYNFVVSRANANPQHSFNLRGEHFVRMALVPIMLLFLYFTGLGVQEWMNAAEGKGVFPLGLSLNAAFFGVMTVIAFVDRSALDNGAAEG